MKILFYFGHPAQYLFLRETIKSLLLGGQHQVKILIKTKDVLEDLIQKDGYDYTNILPEERGKTKLSIAWSLLKRNKIILPIVLKEKPNLLVGTDASLAQIGSMLRIACITITEDDYNVIKTLGRLTYPFTQTILCPEVCDVGKWTQKKVGYQGYMKLGYLHPNIFQANKNILDKYDIKEKYILIRLAKLTAHHDFNIKGIDSHLLDKLIDISTQKSLRVLISSEGKIPAEYASKLLQINTADMHHILAYAELLIADSQSMTVEAAMLGVPSLRFSDFAGRISVLEELEHTYRLTFGFSTGSEQRLLSKLYELLEIEDLKEEFRKRREKMLKDKINVSAFLTWFFGNYPSSLEKLKNNPQFQYTFQ